MGNVSLLVLGPIYLVTFILFVHRGHVTALKMSPNLRKATQPKVCHDYESCFVVRRMQLKSGLTYTCIVSISIVMAKGGGGVGWVGLNQAI